jgi:hypothetical protein
MVIGGKTTLDGDVGRWVGDRRRRSGRGLGCGDGLGHRIFPFFEAKETPAGDAGGRCFAYLRKG